MTFGSMVAGARKALLGWFRHAVAACGFLVTRRKAIEARPNGVLPRPPLTRGARVALRAHNDNGGTAAVRFARTSAGPLIGAYGTTNWHVVTVPSTRVAAASRG